MRQYTPVQSSITCRFAYRNVLPGLPVPSTAAFVQLCKELKIFGFSGEKYTLETPSGKLSDARILLSLVQDSISVRIHYEWFEIVIPVFVEGVDAQAVGIANTTLRALALIDEQATDGDIIVQSQAHLQLTSGDPDEYLAEHFTSSVASAKPDAFAITLHGDTMHRKGRIVVARSIPFAGSLFVDYVGEFANAHFSAAIVEEVQNEYRFRLHSLGLEALEATKRGDK